MNDRRIILGIDPGYARMGWGIIAIRSNNSPFLEGVDAAKDADGVVCINYGCVETPKEEEMGTRLAFLNNQLSSIITQYNPTDIAVEELFFAKNQKTAMLVAHARGVIMMRAAMHSGKIFQYRPNVIKQTAACDPKADKKAIQAAVSQILKLDITHDLDDAADALAVAITHASTLTKEAKC